MHQSMTLHARADRSARRGPQRLLDAEQEAIARGWLIYRNAIFLHTDSGRFLDFLEHLLNVRPYASWLSRWLKRADMSHRIVQPSLPPVLSPDALQKGAAFIRALRAQRRRPDQILFVDQISFGITKKGAREIAPQGTGTLHRAHQEVGVSIQVFTSLVADGRRGAFFAVIPRKKGVHVVLPEEEATVVLLPKKKHGQKRGVAKVLAFLEDAVRRGKLNKGDLLVSDNEGAWKEDEVEHWLSRNGILHLSYPKYLGARLDPCDNSFHSVFRRQYQAAALQHKRLDLEERLKLLNTIYHAIPDEVVEGSIRRCGNAGGDPTDIMNDLLCEGATPKGGLTREQQHDILAYLDFQKRTGFCEPDEPRAGGAIEGKDASEREESDEETDEDE
jgi:hypothetical protein